MTLDLEAIESMRLAAKPGAWYARNGRVERLSGEPVNDEASLRFLAESTAIVGRLVTRVRELEKALATEHAKVINARHEYERQERRHAEEVERMRTVGHGPVEALQSIVRAAALGAYETGVVLAIRRWARGANEADEWIATAGAIIDKRHARATDRTRDVAKWVETLRLEGCEIEAHIVETLLSGVSDNRAVRDLLRVALGHLFGNGKPAEKALKPGQIDLVLEGE